MHTKAASVLKLCKLLSEENIVAAAEYLRKSCASGSVAIPMRATDPKSKRPPGRSVRRYSATQKTELFVRDGFIDRYSGAHLVFPGVLRLLSHLFPSEFPYHPNLKYGVGHSWYWDLYPTVDHTEAAGDDAEHNWVTTSMINNLVKSNASLDELGWILRASKIDPDWDGLLCWYVGYLAERPELHKVSFLKDRYKAGTRVLRC